MDFPQDLFLVITKDFCGVIIEDENIAPQIVGNDAIHTSLHQLAA